MKYTITISELIKRSIIRTDFNEEWKNKMTDEEISQFDRESYDMCLEKGVLKKFPDLNASYLAKYIDRCVLYDLFKKLELS